MTNKDFKLIEGHTFIIAELSANHGGNIENAIETIKAAKRAGADAIKLQTYTPDTITIKCNNRHFTDLLKGTIWEGKTFYDLYTEAYTPWEWHDKLFKAAASEDLVCFSSPFDKSAVDFLEKFNPPAYKIASFEIQDIPLIRYAASKGRMMIISTGIASLPDIELAINTCKQAGNSNIALLKCTSAYPAPLEEANLLTVSDMKVKFGLPIGLSDHTLGTISPVVAVALGATIIEKHFILNKSIGGPDASFSLDEKEFSEMVSAVRKAESAIGSINYDLTEKSLQNKKFGRSLFFVQKLKRGETIREDSIRSIRPNSGLHPKYLEEIIGKTLVEDVSEGTPVNWNQIKLS